VIGEPENVARSTLVGDGFKVDSRQRASGSVTKGNVIDTDPGPGSSADKGSTVTLIVSTGPKSVDLPNLRGKTLPEALQILAQKGLTGAPVNVPSKLASGIVVRTDPKPGPVAPGRVVTLFVSSGNVKVPNVIGMTCDDATKTLENFNLTANCVDAPSDTAPAGQVFAQSPSAGQPAPQGGTVDLQVSTGPAKVTVPDVTNTDYNNAKQILHDNGDLHAVRSNCLSSDPSIPDGVVVATDPPPGSSVDPKSSVTVYTQDSTSVTPCP
jgi:eukaryotic-like serine/threonine-protein kinase